MDGLCITVFLVFLSTFGWFFWDMSEKLLTHFTLSLKNEKSSDDIPRNCSCLLLWLVGFWSSESDPSILNVFVLVICRLFSPSFSTFNEIVILCLNIYIYMRLCVCWRPGTKVRIFLEEMKPECNCYENRFPHLSCTQLYLQYPEQCLVHSRHSVSMCRVKGWKGHSPATVSWCWVCSNAKRWDKNFRKRSQFGMGRSDEEDWFTNPV